MILVALVILAGLASSWVAVRADVPRVASGTWAAAGEIAVPGGAVSVALADGRVVVAGGEDDGTPRSAISTYDPASGAWAHVGNLVTPRSGHAMTVLKDGRVLVAGGTASYGPTFDVEIFDPANGTSVHAGDMPLARVNPAAATLKDGRVLIVGGSDGVSPLNLAEMFDPATGQSQSVPNVMSTARVKATATTLLDGHVLVAGGHDGANDLSSAEIFEPATNSFFATGAMQVARSGHVAVLLPNNNQVLIAGGKSAGAAVASAELYADWRDGFSATPNPMSAARAGGIAAGLLLHDVALVAGGGANGAEYYGYATLKTDKDDYAPYETVTISGSGWQPGEKVQIRVSEDADTHNDWELEAIADEFGNIVNYDFYPRQDDTYQHIGMRFYLSATGIASQALTTFTDAGSIALNPPSGPVATSVTVTSGGGEFAANSSVGIYWDADLVTPLTTCSTNNGGNFPSGTCTFSVPASSAGAHTVTAKQGSISLLATFTVVAASGAGTMVVNPTTVTGGTTGNNFTFTFAAPAGSYTAGSQATITVPPGWTAPTTANTALAASTCTALSRTVSGSTITVNMTCASGQTFSLTYNGITAPGAAGPYTFTTQTKQGASGTLTTIASSPVVTVTPACTPAAVTTQPSNQSVTYGNDATFTAAASGDPAAAVQWQVSIDGVNFTNLSAQTSTTLTLTTPAVSQSGNKYRAVFTNTCGGTQTATSAAATLTVAAKSLTGSFTAANKSYDGTATATITGRSLSGAVSGDDVSLSGGSATFSDKHVADGKTVTGTGFVLAGSAAGNYSLASSTLTTTADIKALAITVTADARSKVYGASDPVLTYTVTSGALASGDSFSGALARVSGENVGTYAITQGTLSAGSNYALTFVGANLTITARPITVTADAKSKTYGDADPALTYQVTAGSMVSGDSFSGALVRTAGENVGDYAINQGNLSAGSNYTLTFVGANLSITARPVTVTADAKTKVYGDDDPTLTYTGVLHGTDTFTGSLARAAGENVGDYAINQGTLTAGSNYTLTFVGANLTISKATLTVTADNKSRPYGDPNPLLTATFAGFKFAESLATSGVAGAPALATVAAQSSPVGPYAITAALGTLASGNYAFAFVNGTLTVDKASLTITANDASRPYGVANPTFSGGYAGQKNGETFTMSFSTSATTFSAVGTYAIVPSADGGTIGNYIVTPTNGTLTVGAWSLRGFYQPVGETSSILSAPGLLPAVSAATVWNSIKGGQTVPLKFNIYRAVGGTQVTTVADAFTGAGFSAYQLPTCAGGYAEDEIPLTDLSTGGTELRWDGTQFIQNWKTPKVSGADLCFRAVVTAKDGSTITAFFKVKK